MSCKCKNPWRCPGQSDVLGDVLPICTSTDVNEPLVVIKVEVGDVLADGRFVTTQLSNLSILHHDDITDDNSA